MASTDYLFMFLSTLKELETKKGTTYGLSISSQNLIRLLPRIWLNLNILILIKWEKK